MVRHQNVVTDVPSICFTPDPLEDSMDRWVRQPFLPILGTISQQDKRGKIVAFDDAGGWTSTFEKLGHEMM